MFKQLHNFVDIVVVTLIVVVNVGVAHVIAGINMIVFNFIVLLILHVYFCCYCCFVNATLLLILLFS